MYQIKITEPAENDIQSAVNYIITELKNPEAGLRLFDDAYKAITSLEEMPYRHPLVKDEILASYGFRFIPVDNYIVFYVVREETETVVIERFLYSRRDWVSILKG